MNQLEKDDNLESKSLTTDKTMKLILQSSVLLFKCWNKNLCLLQFIQFCNLTYEMMTSRE